MGAQAPHLHLPILSVAVARSQDTGGQKLLARALDAENGPLLCLLVKEKVRSAAAGF